MHRELLCHICATPLILSRTNTLSYQWLCPNNCLAPIDTGVPTSAEFDELKPDELGLVEFNASHFFPPMTSKRIATAKVFMPQILYHFIECAWGGCYNSLYLNVLVPHLDSPQALDYVLRSFAVHQDSTVCIGKSGAKVYPELLTRLQRVNSKSVRDYLAENFTG